MSIHPQPTPRPPVPADEEAERLLVGTLLAEGRDASSEGSPIWESVRPIEHLTGRDLFNLIQIRPLWDAIRHRGKAGLDFSHLALNSDAPGKAAIDAAGGISVVITLPSGLPGQIPELVDRLSRASEARTTRKVLTDSVEMIDGNPELASTVRANALKSLQGIGKPRGGFPPPVKLGEWLAKPMPPRPEVIRGLLRRGDKLTLGGSSKSKKTWLASHLALCVSAGKPWLGFQTAKTPVLYLNLELPEDSFHDRMGRLCDALGIRRDEADVTVWNLRGQRASIERIADELDEYREPVGLVVLDPLYKVLGDRVENAAEDVADLFNHLDALTTRHKCAMVVPAHFSKGNQSEKEAIDRISGSGVFGRDADAIVTMTAHEQQECFAIDSTLRSFAPVDPFVVRWEFPNFVREGHLDPSQLKKRAGAKPRFDREEFVALLGPTGKTLVELRKAAQDAFGMSPQRVYSLHSELLGKRIIPKPGTGHPPVFVAKP